VPQTKSQECGTENGHVSRSDSLGNEKFFSDYPAISPELTALELFLQTVKGSAHENSQSSTLCTSPSTETHEDDSAQPQNRSSLHPLKSKRCQQEGNQPPHLNPFMSVTPSEPLVTPGPLATVSPFHKNTSGTQVNNFQTIRPQNSETLQTEDVQAQHPRNDQSRPQIEISQPPKDNVYNTESKDSQEEESEPPKEDSDFIVDKVMVLKCLEDEKIKEMESSPMNKSNQKVEDVVLKVSNVQYSKDLE